MDTVKVPVEIQQAVFRDAVMNDGKTNKHYIPATRKRIIIGTVLSVIAAVSLVIVFYMIAHLTLDEELVRLLDGHTGIARFFQLLYNFNHGYIAAPEGAWGGYTVATGIVMFIGLLSGVMDDALCLLPLGRTIRSHIGIRNVKWYIRIIPALLYGVYRTFYDFTEKASFHSQLDIHSFSLTGKGYEPWTWCTQIFLFLIGITFLLLLAEAFANSGVFGFIIRAPLLLALNLTMGILCYVFVMFSVLFVILAVVGIVLLIVLRLYPKSSTTEVYEYHHYN